MHDLVGRSSQLATILVRRKLLKDGCGRRRTSRKRNCNAKKKGRQARLFFTAVNQSSNSILTAHAEDGQQRMPLYTSKWRRAHNAVYWFDHKLAEDNGPDIFGNVYQWPFTLNFAIPAGCFVKVVRRNRGDVEDETLCQKETREPREAPRVELDQSPSSREYPPRIRVQDDLPFRVPIFLVSKVDERFHGCTTT